jgi:hypothetical protein
LLIFLPDARLLRVELKAATGNLSPAQRTWHATIAALGHRVSVCRSIEDMQAALGAEGVPAIATVNAYHQKAHCGLPDERMEAGKRAMRAPNFGDTGA